METINHQRVSNKRRLLENALALYANQFAGYIFPLILIPYIARTLHPAALGKVAMAQVFATWSAMLMNFGFSLSASREVATSQDDPAKLSEIFSSVLAAKGMLACIVVLLAILAGRYVQIFRETPSFLFAALLIAAMNGMNLTWFFLGLERVRFITFFDLAAKSCSLAGVLLTVKGPQDAWKVLAFQGAGATIPAAAGMVIAMRYAKLKVPTLARTWRTIAQSWSFFLVNSIITFYGSANIMILGTVQSARIVGFYSGADKCVRPFCNLFGPITQALYPRISILVNVNFREASRLAFRSMRILVSLGIAIGLIVSISAPLIVKIMLGNDYLASIPVIRLLAWLIPLTAAGFCVGQQGMLPFGFEKIFVRTVMVCAVVDVCLAYVFSSKVGAVGLVLAMIIAETITVVGNYWYLSSRGVAPHQWHQQREVPISQVLSSQGHAHWPSPEISVETLREEARTD